MVLAPLLVGALGVVIERTLLKRLYKIDPIYGLLLTFGLALIAPQLPPFDVPEGHTEDSWLRELVVRLIPG